MQNLRWFSSAAKLDDGTMVWWYDDSTKFLALRRKPKIPLNAMYGDSKTRTLRKSKIPTPDYKKRIEYFGIKSIY